MVKHFLMADGMMIHLFTSLGALLLLSVQSLAQDKHILVHYGNRSFDVTPFVPHHPGGPLVLEHVNGKDITEYLAGRKSVILSEMGGIVVRHHHSQGAFHVLNSLEIKDVEKEGKAKVKKASNTKKEKEG